MLALEKWILKEKRKKELKEKNLDSYCRSSQIPTISYLYTLMYLSNENQWRKQKNINNQNRLKNK